MLEILVWPAVVVICTIILSVAASLIFSERVELEREQDVRHHAFASDRARERSEELEHRVGQQAAQMEAIQSAVEALAPAIGPMLERLLGACGPAANDPVDSGE